MKIVKNKGPSTEPRRTPLITDTLSRLQPSTANRCGRSAQKKRWDHWWVFPLVTYWCSFRNIHRWGRDKILQKHIKSMSVWVSLSMHEAGAWNQVCDTLSHNFPSLGNHAGNHGVCHFIISVFHYISDKDILQQRQANDIWRTFRYAALSWISFGWL